MPVKFNPIVKVREMDVTKAEHAAEVRNPKNMILVVPHESLVNNPSLPDTHTLNTLNTLNISGFPGFPGLAWIIIIILILIVIIVFVRRKNKSPATDLIN